ncbi:D-2-hydroxyacid dehydrogenase [Nocardioides caldifontis]|uniref:D-2-hydroxyacid dehydrogenase n=1 Tax=Nocardioides caldifontis TaxID=2588938 RepID=UPI0011E0002F|nr:D-2-hydroxyacid dehydrogenase [Nocardioides caldifontis]
MHPRPDDASTRPVVVVLCDGERPPAERLAPLESRVDLRYVGPAELPVALPDARALLHWSAPAGTLEAAWSRATRLQWVHYTYAGVDGLLFDALRDSDVVLTNARGAFDRPMAEYVLAAILAHAKQLHLTYDLQRARTWERRDTTTVVGSTVLVVGTGSIGRETARLLRAVGMAVRGAGRTARDADPDFDRVVASSELADHVGWADHVVLLAPLTEATRDLVDEEVIARMKPTAHLVSAGRGLSVDEDALVAALEGGRLAGATLDVFRTEPLPSEHPLWTTPGVVVSPHMSGDVVGDEHTLARQFADNAQRWLAGEPFRNVVDKQLGFAAPEGP